jgi:hypothetical protein
MANGQIVFNDVPSALTSEIAQALYDIEAGDVMDASSTMPIKAASSLA